LLCCTTLFLKCIVKKESKTERNLSYKIMIQIVPALGRSRDIIETCVWKEEERILCCSQIQHRPGRPGQGGYAHGQAYRKSGGKARGFGVADGTG
jgi:hypothetical protein